MTTLDRKALTTTALDDWAELRRSVTDPNELARIQAEMVGWLAHRDPIALAEFTKMQRDRIAFLATPDPDDEEADDGPIP